MLIIIGESASGKTTLQKYICKHSKLKPCVSTTTRPKRENEVDGIDYNFVSQDEYNRMLNNKEFVEAAVYNNWFYGLTKNELADDKVFVATPAGLRKIKRFIKENKETKINIVSVYLKVDRISRLIKLLKRDGEKNIDESIRRNNTDVGQYDAVEDECDITINNSEYRLSVETIYEQLKNELNKRGMYNEDIFI